MNKQVTVLPDNDAMAFDLGLVQPDPKRDLILP